MQSQKIRLPLRNLGRQSGECEIVSRRPCAVLGRPRRVHIAGATELRGVFLSLRNPPAEVEMSNRREYVSQLLHSSRVVHDYLRLRLVRRMVMIRIASLTTPLSHLNDIGAGG